MKVTHKGVFTGKEVMDLNPNLTGLDLEAEYNYTQGTKMYGNKIECELYRINSIEENNQMVISNEIQELNQWLDLRRNIEHPDKAAKQARLLELLG